MPTEARWAKLKAQAKPPIIGRSVDDAIAGIERDNSALKGEVSTHRRKNLVQARSFAQMLERTLRRYQFGAVEAA